MLKKYDYLIFGAGIYGLYAARLLGKRGLKVAVVEHDDGPFQRASYINQARVHHGYHYPRSISTAAKTAKYYYRFNEEFSFAVNMKFKKVYAISTVNSLTNARQFKKFCDYVNIPAVEINPELYFNNQYIESAFETEEFAFDAFVIRDRLMEQLSALKNVDFFFRTQIKDAAKSGRHYLVSFDTGLNIETPAVLNATYASINQLLNRFGFASMKIKYEICEVILVNVHGFLEDVGLTVMDGQFFSVMPFGLIGKHSLTSVAFTPHLSSYDALPTFSCQYVNTKCSPQQLENCNLCPARPKTAWPYMSQLGRKYLRDDSQVTYDSSLFAIKPILLAAELDDSRPTVIRKLSDEPSFISVLSGKINTLYDLDEVL
ncbi:MAG: FAD-binding oxidoreductase [Deltaproteobacteria bacterium]|nr:FAD-binding oxidoreductase [Deltaproteobacteria bacterium]